MGLLVDFPDGVPVMLFGTSVSEEFHAPELENLGHYEVVCDDACGIGKGANACRFGVIAGSAGFQCGRYGGLHWTLSSPTKKMVAQREPYQPYPDCKKEGWKDLPPNTTGGQGLHETVI
jgi:hypothetical protein